MAERIARVGSERWALRGPVARTLIARSRGAGRQRPVTPTESDDREAGASQETEHRAGSRSHDAGTTALHARRRTSRAVWRQNCIFINKARALVNNNARALHAARARDGR